jgi:hypothetical protein
MVRNASLKLMAFFCAATSIHGAEPDKKATALEALKPFNLLIGKWNASGVPEGTAADRDKGHWMETIDWTWQLKGDDAWLVALFEKGKFFKRGELRHLPKENAFQLKLETTDKQTLIFQGPFKEHELRLERIDGDTKDTQRLIFALLHRNRINYRFEVKPADKTFFTKLYRVGATKDGEPLVETGPSEKECVVSGGAGTRTVMYRGKTYYVCCSGCRDAFMDDPERFIKEFEKRRAKQDKKTDK